MGVGKVLKLLHLEMRKCKIGGFIRGAIIANVILLGFFLLISFDFTRAGGFAFQDYQEVFSVIDSLVRGTFIVFAAVLLSRFVIGEFKNQAITVLFMYPINRKKMMMAKILIVVIFTLLAIVTTNLFINISFYFLDIKFHFVPESLTMSLVIKNSIKMLMNALAASSMCLIPLYVGMKKYSIQMTIVSSLPIAAIVSSNSGGVTFNDIIAVPITLAFIGAFIAYLTIRNVEKIDITF